MMNLGRSVIKSRTPGGPGYNIVRTVMPDIAGSLVRSLPNVTVLALKNFEVAARFFCGWKWLRIMENRGVCCQWQRFVVTDR
jgi:hypothetical protein